MSDTRFVKLILNGKEFKDLFNAKMKFQEEYGEKVSWEFFILSFIEK